MAKLVVLYNTPADPAAFDAYYESRHVPIAKQIPGLREVRISTGPVMTPGGPAPYHLVAVLGFDSSAALQAGLAAPEGQAAAADLANFATGGASILLFEDKAL
jgi:uncharacterized protein (TIGR02118 family)